MDSWCISACLGKMGPLRLAVPPPHEDTAALWQWVEGIYHISILVTRASLSPLSPFFALPPAPSPFCLTFHRFLDLLKSLLLAQLCHDCHHLGIFACNRGGPEFTPGLPLWGLGCLSPDTVTPADTTLISSLTVSIGMPFQYLIPFR